MGGSVGTSIGKLPTSKSTKHIPKTKLPIGGVNSKHQMKVKGSDGIIRFINMADGRVKGNSSGVPVKPEKLNDE